MDKIAPYAKAFIAAIIAGLSAIATGLVSDGLSWSEGVVAAIAFFTGLLAVFSVPNRPPFVPEQTNKV
jgi:hypothetical protein